MVETNRGEETSAPKNLEFH